MIHRIRNTYFSIGLALLLHRNIKTWRDRACSLGLARVPVCQRHRRLLLKVMQQN